MQDCSDSVIEINLVINAPWDSQRKSQEILLKISQIYNTVGKFYQI